MSLAASEAEDRALRWAGLWKELLDRLAYQALFAETFLHDAQWLVDMKRRRWKAAFHRYEAAHAAWRDLYGARVMRVTRALEIDASVAEKWAHGGAKADGELGPSPIGDDA